jgi:hypothetical protein
MKQSSFGIHNQRHHSADPFGDTPRRTKPPYHRITISISLPIELATTETPSPCTTEPNTPLINHRTNPSQAITEPHSSMQYRMTFQNTYHRSTPSPDQPSYRTNSARPDCFSPSPPAAINIQDPYPQPHSINRGAGVQQWGDEF